MNTIRPEYEIINKLCLSCLQSFSLSVSFILVFRYWYESPRTIFIWFLLSAFPIYSIFFTLSLFYNGKRPNALLQIKSTWKVFFKYFYRKKICLFFTSVLTSSLYLYCLLWYFIIVKMCSRKSFHLYMCVFLTWFCDDVNWRRTVTL